MKPEGYKLPRVDEPFAELRIIDDEPDLAGSIVISSIRFAVNGITVEAQRDVALRDLTALLRAMGQVR